MGAKLFSQSRFKQLAQQLGKLLVLVLALNIGLENIYSNYLLADATNTTRLAVLNTIKNNLAPAAPTNPILASGLLTGLSTVMTNLTAAVAPGASNPNLLTPANLNNNNSACASGTGNCKCTVAGLCAAGYTPVAITSYIAINQPTAPILSYENLALSWLYMGANVAYALNQVPVGKGFIWPFGTPANTATLANLLANFMVPDSTTYPGLALDKDSGILIKTPAATPAGTVSPFCQALITANPLNQVAPTANNIWLGAICANNTHCCGTNICNLTSGADLGKDSAGNSYGFCDSGCSKFNQSCTSDSNCCGAAESDSPVVCDLTVKKCVSCVVAGDGCFADTDCCAAQNLKCDESSMTCVSCVPAGDKAVQATDCCPETNFNSSTKTCDSTCGLVTSSCKTSSDCCTSQGLTCDRITKTCLWDVGRTCDPKDSFKNHYCRDGLSCDSTTLQCEINLGKICAVTPNNCLTGLVCDPVSVQCCKPLNSDCASDQDCFYGYVCDNPQKAATGVCKLKAEASCTTPFKATDCAAGLACGFASGSTDNKYTCCAPAGSEYSCKFDSDCCGGALCDGTSGAYKCVECIPIDNDCAGIEGRCCPDMYCDAGSGQCVPLTERCPPEDQSCNKFSDCGGSGCGMVCDVASNTCQVVGAIGTICVSDDSCKIKNYETGDLEDAGFRCTQNSRAQITNWSCCAPLARSCEKDSDCCDDKGGTVTCINNQCQLSCIADGQLCGASFPNENGPPASGVSCCKTNSAGQELTCQDQQGTWYCDTTLKVAGEACSESKECDGYDDRVSDRAAECNMHSDPHKCCSLVNGACNEEHDDHGNSDCCDDALNCIGGKCIFDEKPWKEELAIGGGEFTLQILLGLLIYYVGRAGEKSDRESYSHLADLLGFNDTEKQLLDNAYDRSAFVKNGNPEARNNFAIAVIAALKSRCARLDSGIFNWKLLVTNSNVSDSAFSEALVQVVTALIGQRAGDVVVQAEAAAASKALGGVRYSLPGQIGAVFRKFNITGEGLKTIMHVFDFRAGGRAATAKAFEEFAKHVTGALNSSKDTLTEAEAKTFKSLADLFDIAKAILTVQIATTGGGDTDGVLGKLAEASAALRARATSLSPVAPVRPPVTPLDITALNVLNTSLKEKISTATMGVTLAGKNADQALIDIGKASDGKLSMLMLLRASQKELTDYKDVLNDLITELNNSRGTDKITATFANVVDKATFLNIVAASLGDFPDTGSAPNTDFMTNKVGDSMRATCQAIATQKGGGITAAQVYAKLYSVAATSERPELKQLMPDWRSGAVEPARMDLPRPL